MYGKIVNDELIIAPERVLEYETQGKHRIICNPQPKHYAEAGYKAVEYSEMPEATEAQEVLMSYEETDDKIIVKYAIRGDDNE